MAAKLARGLVAILLLASSSQIQAASLLSNPGFESDPGGHNQSLLGWQQYGPNTYNETDASLAHGGTNYFKVYQSFSGSENYSGVYQDYISGPGAKYTAGGWACIPAGDAIAGQNAAWVEISFRDEAGTMLGLYRSAIITSNVIGSSAFPTGNWNYLPVTNQYNPVSFQVTNAVTQLVAPAGTVFLRYQIVFQGDASGSGGSVYFDDLNLNQAGGAPYGNMNIVWTDEFDGDSLKTNIWTYDLGAGGWGNNEFEYYTSRSNNSYVTNGLLHIVARQESYGNANYTSARIKSQSLFACTYGRIEWRAKTPQGVGFWPALWLLGTNITTIGWPGCGEIDLFENNGGNPLMAQGSLHSGSDSTDIYNFIDGESVTNFHIYTLDWTTNAFLFYVDGHLYQRQMSWSSAKGTYPFPFDQPFFLIMNLAVGGNYLGNPSTGDINSGSVFPGEMQVDYVRIYRVTDPLRLAIKQAGPNLLLTWPGDIICRLQSQSNLLASNWLQVNVATNQTQISPYSGSTFYRLVMP